MSDPRPPYDITRSHTETCYYRQTNWGEPWVFDTSAPFSVRSLSGAIRNARKPDGWRNPSPLSGQKIDGQLLIAEHQWRGNDYTTTVGPYVEPGIPPYWGYPADVNELVAAELSRARMRALGKLKQQAVNLSVAFAERQKTADMIGDAARGIVTMIRDIRRGKLSLADSRGLNEFKRRGFNRDAMPSHWLAYRYGIAPTVLDVYGGLEAIEKQDNGTYDRYFVTIRGKSQTELPSTTSPISGWFGPGYIPVHTAGYLTMTSGKIGARVRYDAYLKNATYLRLSEVGVTNPLEWAYELVPLSFVLDWFVGCGDFLAALDASAPWDLRGGSETTFRDWSGVKTLAFAPYSDQTVDNTTFDCVSSGAASASSFDRRVVDQFPFPEVVRAKNPLNLTRMADGLSLLSQMVKSLLGGKRV